ncbi:hypothetical protein GmHk_18G050789 [Glycine max]|nr:hypothetical protein GmHk_18G050789 [Glycine max]
MLNEYGGIRAQCVSHAKCAFTFQNYILGANHAFPVEPVHRAERLRRAKRVASHLQFASWDLLYFPAQIIH